MHRSCDRLLQKILPSCTRFALHGVLSLLLQSLNYLDDEEARKGTVLLLKSSKTKFSTVEDWSEAFDEGEKNTIVPESEGQHNAADGTSRVTTWKVWIHLERLWDVARTRRQNTSCAGNRELKANYREQTVTNLLLPGALWLTADFALGSSESSCGNGAGTRRLAGIAGA